MPQSMWNKRNLLKKWKMPMPRWLHRLLPFLNLKGIDCSKKICPDDCNGNGICDSNIGICKCYSGFEGKACQNKVCLNNCSGNGTCSQITKKCICNNGYLGEDCSKKVCINNCSGNGFCNDGKCYCRPGFEGILKHISLILK